MSRRRDPRRVTINDLLFTTTELESLLESEWNQNRISYELKTNIIELIGAYREKREELDIILKTHNDMMSFASELNTNLKEKCIELNSISNVNQELIQKLLENEKQLKEKCNENKQIITLNEDLKAKNLELKTIVDKKCYEFDRIFWRNEEMVNKMSELKEMNFKLEQKNEELLEKYKSIEKQNQLLEKKVIKEKEIANEEIGGLNGQLDMTSSASPYFSISTTLNINTTQPNETIMSSLDPNSNIKWLKINRRLPKSTGSPLVNEYSMNPMAEQLVASKQRDDCSLNDSVMVEQRMETIESRNAMVLPHLKSSYPTEMTFTPPKVTPKTIKQDITSTKVFKRLKSEQIWSSNQ